MILPCPTVYVGRSDSTQQKKDSSKPEAKSSAKPSGIVEGKAESPAPGSSKGASAPKERVYLNSYDPSAAYIPSLAVANKEQNVTAKRGLAAIGPVEGDKKEQPKVAEEAKPVQKDDNKAPSDGKNNDSIKPASEGKDNSSSDKPDHSFNDDEDKQLLELKANGDSWKVIAQKLKKPQGLIKKRFNEISTDEQKEEGQQKTSGKQQPANTCKSCGCHAKEGKAEKAQDNKDAAEQNAAPAVANQGTSNPSGNGRGDGDWDIRTVSEPESDRGYFVLYPDATFSEDDVSSKSLFSRISKGCGANVTHPQQCEALARAIYSDYEGYHLRLASRIFDKTGHRISPQAVKVKLGGRARRKSNP